MIFEWIIDVYIIDVVENLSYSSGIGWLIPGYRSLHFKEQSKTYNGVSLVWTRNLSDDFYSICNFWLKLPKLEITPAFEIGSVFPLIIVDVVGIALSKNFQGLTKMLTHILTLTCPIQTDNELQTAFEKEQVWRNILVQLGTEPNSKVGVILQLTIWVKNLKLDRNR